VGVEGLSPVPEAAELPPDRAAHMLEAGEAEIVDVRTPEEHEAGHIGGSRHIPIEQLSEAAEDLDPSKRTVFYCRSGDRSATAAEAFIASGREAYSIAGGLLAWAELGLPLQPAGGRVAERTPLPSQ
jgi:rhodanese-related sulfurtransferase